MFISISIMGSPSVAVLAGGLMFAFGFIALLVYTLILVITLLITLVRRKKKLHSN